MDDLELLQSLAGRPERARDAQAFAQRLFKTAGLKDQAREGLKKLRGHLAANKAEIIGGAVGGLAGGAYGYATSKRWKPDQPSLMEQDAEDLHRMQEKSEAAVAASGKKPGFGHKMRGLGTRTAKEVAQIAKDHPVAFGVMTGASTVGLGRMVGKKMKERFSETVRKAR